MSSINRRICKFIYNEWVLKASSQRFFADSHSIDERIVRKIKIAAKKVDFIEYDIPMSTLEKICKSHDLKFSEFFLMVEEYKSS